MYPFCTNPSQIMWSQIILLIIGSALISCKVIFEELNYLPDYGYPNPIFPRTNIRENFIKNRKRTNETAKKIQLLDNIINNTLYIDEIAHYKIDNKHSQWKKVNEIETEFRNLIGMKGLIYTYKRDMFWRTWRKVNYPESDRIIWYRCESSVFTNYQNCGHWVIEEKPPPCPYELFSISYQNKICAIQLEQYHDEKSNCNTTLSISDLTGTCDNPIVTEWRIRKKFNDVDSERFPAGICEGRESCNLTTLYKIASDHISFRIINSSNSVIYSRIMKDGNLNYACVEECGKMNANSKTISKVEKSLLINLLTKNKREDISVKFIKQSSTKNKHTTKDNSNLMHVKTLNNFMVTKNPTCKSIKALAKDDAFYYD